MPPSRAQKLYAQVQLAAKRKTELRRRLQQATVNTRVAKDMDNRHLTSDWWALAYSPISISPSERELAAKSKVVRDRLRQESNTKKALDNANAQYEKALEIWLVEEMREAEATGDKPRLERAYVQAARISAKKLLNDEE
jgi:hypothetical protein